MRLPTNGVKLVALSRMRVMHYLVADYKKVCVSCSVIIVMSGKPVYYVRVMCKYNYLLTNISSSTVVVGSNPALGSGGVGGDEKLLDLF
jgi:hypothetical protein